jgi:hypothetical protein
MSPLSSTIACRRTRDGTICIVTYQYAATGALRHARVEALARVDGREQVVGRGVMRGRRLRLSLAHLRHGRYRLAIVARTARGSTLIGRTTLTVS